MADYTRGDISSQILRCVTREEGNKILREIHGGVCGNHAGARSLAHKTIRTGYFWPTLHEDAKNTSSSCMECQQFTQLVHQPHQPLTLIKSPWPFAQWGLDLVGKLPAAKGQFHWVIVAMDYHTKWAEAEPLTSITTTKGKNFLWKNIYCRFGVPDTIIIR